MTELMLVEGTEAVRISAPFGGFHGEAEFVCTDLMAKKDESWSDFAILYRTNAQSALLEREFIKHRVRYTVRGGATFFARREVYHMVFFLAAAFANNVDAIIGIKRNEAAGIPGFTGIGNMPTLSFGKTTRYLGAAAWDKLDMIYKSTVNPDMVQVVREFERSLDSRSRPGARDLGDMLQNLRAEADTPGTALDWVLENIYQTQLQLDTDGDEDAFESKMSSIRVLQDIAQEYTDIKEFVSYCLERMMEGASKKQQTVSDAVQMMSIHASKGLEFKHVYVLGVNQGFLPHARGDGAEELRLFYVAITRAEESVTLMSPVGVDYFGRELAASEFLSILTEEEDQEG